MDRQTACCSLRRFSLSVLFILHGSASTYGAEPVVDNDIEGEAVEQDDQERRFSSFQITGAAALELRRGTLPEDAVLYRARPGEIITLDSKAHGGWRLADVWRPAGAQSELDSPAFARDQRLREVGIGNGTSPQGVPARVDVDDGAQAPVFAGPGFTDRDCQLTPQRCVARLPVGAKVRIIESRLMTYEDLTGTRRVGNFYRVEAESPTRGRRLSGWIDADQVRGERRVPGRSSPSEEPCPPPGSPSIDPPATFFQRMGRGATRLAAEAIGDRLSNEVGQCLLKDDERPPDARPPIPTRSAYDERVSPHWREPASAQTEGLNGRPISRSELEAIDVLARTLYAEMAGCASRHTHYYTAVAAVALNRVKGVARNPALRSPFALMTPAENRHPLVDVLMSPMQFSPWNRTRTTRQRVQERGKPPKSILVTGGNPSLRTALCPPSRAGLPHARAARPTPIELEAWKNATRVATHAVLAPEDFLKRVDFTAMSFTSGEDVSIAGLALAPLGFADGQPIDNPNCMQLWVSTRTTEPRGGSRPEVQADARR